MDEKFVEEIEESSVVMLPPELPSTNKKEIKPYMYIYGIAALSGVGTLIAWMLS
jgi:hypothetical protein